MKKDFWSCNIDRRGRLIRCFAGVLCLIAAVVLFLKFDSVFWSTGLLSLGIVAMFEGLRGWCVARAFGIQTPF